MKSLDVTLDQTGPGRYEASFEARQLGTYLANIRTKRDGTTTSQITGAVLPYSPEYSAIGTNEFLLGQMSETAEGDRFTLQDAAKIFNRPRTTARAPKDIWLPLLMLAALLFPIDVAVRRLMWGETELRNLRNRLRAPKLPRKKGKTPQPRDEKLGALLKAKQRAGREGRQETGEGRQETGDKRQETVERQIPVAPPPPGGVAAPSQAPPPRSSAPEPAPEPTEPEEEDALTRLRRAKERARRDS